MKKVLKGIFWIFVLISVIGLPATLVNYYSNGVTFLQSVKDVFTVLGYFFFGGLIIVGIPSVIAGFMESASKDKNSKAYKIFDGLNVISTLFLIVIALGYFIPNGIHGLKMFYKENLYWFTAFIVSLAFSGYWWWLKKGRNYTIDGSEQYKIGCEHLTGGDISEALKYFDTAIKSGYQNAHLFYDRARCLADLKYYSEAIEDFDKAIEINSEKADMYHARHFCKMEIGDFCGALSDLQEALRLSKLDNENNNFWNEYAKKTGYASATERYEMDFSRAEFTSQMVYEYEKALHIPEFKIKLDEIKANHQLNKERNRSTSPKKETKTTQIRNPEKEEKQSDLTHEERVRMAAKIRSLKSTGNSGAYEKFRDLYENELNSPKSPITDGVMPIDQLNNDGDNNLSLKHEANTSHSLNAEKKQSVKTSNDNDNKSASTLTPEEQKRKAELLEIIKAKGLFK
jgi:tetratricopeptide (TPR) repeat protein